MTRDKYRDYDDVDFEYGQYWKVDAYGEKLPILWELRNKEYLKRIWDRTKHGPFTRLMSTIGKPEEDWLYEVTYDNIDYTEGKRYYSNHLDVSPGLCSSVRNGNFYGRNLDWYYSNSIDFIVRVKAHGDRYASIGVAFIDGLESTNSKWVNAYRKGYELPEFKALPFRTVDGINEYGVVCNVNVVPANPIDDKERAKATLPTTIPDIEVRDSICSAMVVRYILDHFKSAREAVRYIRDYVSVYASPQRYWETGFEQHFMVADKDETYLIEFINNKTVVTDMSRLSGSHLENKPYMTNFRLSEVNFDEGGKIKINRDLLPNESNVEPHGCGLERYNHIVENYDSANTYEGMRALMTSLFYGSIYKRLAGWEPGHPEGQDGIWYTDFTGTYKNGTPADGEYTVSQPITEHPESVYWDLAMPYFKAAWPGTREVGSVWQTTHSCVYDIENKKMHLVAQENPAKTYTFQL